MNEALITNMFQGLVFSNEDRSININWNEINKDGILDTDFYRLRIDTFYTFDPSINSTYSGRLYERTAYISEINEKPTFLPPQEGIFGYSNIKNFSYDIEDQYEGSNLTAVGLEIEAHSPTRDKSSVLDTKLTAEWWHLESTKENASYLGMEMDVTDNLYQTKPVVGFSEDTIRPMEIYSKAHMVSGSEDGSSRLQTYSGWDKVAGVWFDEDSNLKYSGKDRVERSAIDNAISYEQYEIPDSEYQHYENELYTKYRILYSGEEANKYKDARQVTFTRNDNELVSVERKITRASSSDDFFGDWETLSESAGSPFLDSEELFNYVSEGVPVEIEDVYEVVPYTGNTSLGENYAEIDIIPDIGWDLNKSDYLPLCLKEDELFFRDGCNIRIRQEGMLDIIYNKYSEAKIYFQDTNTAPLSGYKVEFQAVPPDESRIFQLQSVETNLNDGDSVYFLGQAVSEDSVGEAVWDEEHYGKVPTDSEAILGISPETAVESSRKITSTIDYGVTRNIDRGSPIGPRVVSEEEYSAHLSGQKYITYPHGAYPGYFTSRNFSSAGVLYSNFGEVSLWDAKSRSLYEQKINQEDKIYFKDERETRTFESGICDGLASIDIDTSIPKKYIYYIGEEKHEIKIKRENGSELGIRDGIISCEPEGDEENYFFSSSNPASPTDTFRGNGRLNYFMVKDYIQNSYGNVLEIKTVPNEKISLDLSEDLFNDGEVYYVERDVYVAKDESFQANYREPENVDYSGEELHYLTQTLHEINIDSLPNKSPLKNYNYFNQQRKFIEKLEDTSEVLKDAFTTDTDKISKLIIQAQEESKIGVMVQKSESEYFPNKDTGTVSSGGEVSFSGLTPGNYYELQIKNNGEWETAKEGDFAPNKKAVETGLSFSDISDGTYRLEKWVKQFSYGSVPDQITFDLGVLDDKIKYRLVKLEYSMSLRQGKCDWIINRNAFVNSNVIHNKALSASETKEEDSTKGFISTIVPGDNYFYASPTDDNYNRLEKQLIMSSVFSLPSNPHILRNMEGTPFKSAKALRAGLEKSIENPEYTFNDELFPYYVEARGRISTELGGSGARIKGGAAIDKKEKNYAYDSFSRLRVTKYIYRIYKKHAVLLGDLAKRNGERDYGGWDFELDKSVKDSSGSWGDWQSANVIATDKIRSNYYPAGSSGIPRSLYFKNYGLLDNEPEFKDGSFDDCHTIDAVMLTTDETEKYEPSEIRFRIKKKQIIETDNDCRVLSKYNFLPLSLSWDFLKGAKNLAAGLTGGGPYEIELTDPDTNSYAIKKAENEEVMLLNGEKELAVYGLVEDKESGLLRRRKISDFKVSEPVKISNIPQDADGKVKLKIVSSGSGDVLTEILKLPSSYTIRQIAKVNDEIKTTHEREVQGHEANFINIGECGDEIYNIAADFECMNEDDGPLVNYEVVARGFGATDDTAVTLGGDDVATGYQNDFYNPPFQTSNFTISGDNAGVFVCSGSAEIEVTVDTDKDFHVVNVNEDGDSDVTVNFSTPLTINPRTGVNQDGQIKDVTVLSEDSYSNTEYVVSSDYSRIPHQPNFDTSSPDTFKLIEDENIYLELSDNDEQIVFDCLSKINLPSSPTTFSFTGINITTESVPMVSPNNHLINGELVHYLKPRSESKISYTSNTFSVETISELETLMAQENIDRTKLLTLAKATLNSSSLTSGQIYITKKPNLEITLDDNLADDFVHAFVIKLNNTDSNTIKIINAYGNGNDFEESKILGVIIRRIEKDGGWENEVEIITKNFPRATLGTNVGDANFSMASDATLNWIVPSTADKEQDKLTSVDFTHKIKHIELDSSSPNTTEINVPTSAKGNHIYIRNTSDQQKFIEFYNDKNEILSHFQAEGNDISTTNLTVGKGQLVRVKFIENKNEYSMMVFQIHGVGKDITNWSYNDDPTKEKKGEPIDLMMPDKENTLVVPFEDSIVAKSSLIKLVNTAEGENIIYEVGDYETTGIAVEGTSVSLSENEEIIFYIGDSDSRGIGTFTLSEDAEEGAVILYGNLAGDTNFNSSWGLQSDLDHAGKRVTTTYDGNYYKSSSKIGFHYLIIPEICFSSGGITGLIGELTTDDDFKVIVLPRDAPNGGTYHLNYSKFTEVGDKIFVVPLYGEVNADDNYNSTVTHQGQQFYWPDVWNEDGGIEIAAQNGDPYFNGAEEGEEEVEITSSKVLAFERKSENGEDGIHISMLVSESESSGDDSGPIEDENVRVVKAGEKIIRIASEEVKTIDLNTRIAGSDHSEILIINETLVETPVEIITKLGGLTTPILLDKRSAAKFTYNTVGPKYEKSDVQFYEVVYYSEYPDRTRDGDPYGKERPLLKTNKFYDKSDYDNFEVLLFNTSVKIEGTQSSANRWIDGEKYRCNMVEVEGEIVTPLYNQIKYAYDSSSLNLNRYYILDTPLHIEGPTTNSGLVINKSNSVVNMGTDVLYSDEVWSKDDVYLRSPNLRNEDFFIRLSNHTIIPRYNLGPNVTLEEELKYNQEEVTNFCRIHKLSPRANNDNSWEWDKWGNLVNINNEEAEDWPDGGLYKYGIKLYGNQLNSSKKINFEFDYDNYYTTNDKQLGVPKVFNDLIYGKKIPSRALAGAIGFSVNTGHESIVRCVSFNERTGEAVFSGIQADKKHIVTTQGYIPLTNSYVGSEGLPETVVHPTIKYNGEEYKNGEKFDGISGLSTYSIRSLDYANVKISLLHDFVDQINELQEDPDEIQTTNQVVHPPVAEAESAWVKMPSDTKTITINGDYKDRATYITVGSGGWTSSASPAEPPAVGEIFLFGTETQFTIDFIVTAPSDEALTLYGSLKGGDLYSGDVGEVNLSKEIKDSQEWGTVIKNNELLSGYRWSNFQIYHTSDYADVGNLLTDDDLIINTDEEKDTIEFSERKNQWHFIIIKLRKGKTLSDYTYQISSDSIGNLIKILVSEDEDKHEVYVLRREYEDDPPFNKYSEIKGITLTEPAHDDGIERVKIGRSEAFVPNDSYTIISTDNQAFQNELSTTDSERAKASERYSPIVPAGHVASAHRSDRDIITAEESLELRNEIEEQIALNPTKNYANEVGRPAEKTFFTSDILKTSEKIKVRLSRLIGKRVILKDYADDEIVKNLENLNIKHQLKYILEGELSSAYVYDEKVCKGVVSLGSVLHSPTGSNSNTMIVKDSLLKSGDAIIFETVDGSDVTLGTHKVYFVESIDLDDSPTKFYLLRAKKLGGSFKETFTSLDIDSKFRIVSETDTLPKAVSAIAAGNVDAGSISEGDVSEGHAPAESFCCLDSNEYVIVNETCFKINPAFQNDEGNIEGGILGLELESYSFEYREKAPPDENGEIYPLSVSNDNILDIFKSRNNFVKNFYVIRYHKEDKKTVVLHLTKGRTYRYFIINKEGEINVDKIVYGPSDPSDTITSLGANSKGTFEAKQEKIEMIFNSEVKIENLSSYICILEELKYEETNKELIFKPHGGSEEVQDFGFHSMLKGQGKLHETSLEDVFLDWEDERIYDTILPAEISEIYPHEKEMTGGNVELSWIISEKYWDGFWFKSVKYLPKYYKCIIYKKNSNNVESEINTRTIENYLYPRILASGGFLKLDDVELVSSGSINYDKRTLMHIIEGDELENGTLEYKAGTNEEYLLYDNKRYIGSASITYIKGKRIELISKVPEIERPSFITEKETGDTFRVEITEEALFIGAGGFNKVVKPQQISKPLRLPLNWVSTFSTSDIKNTQKFKDNKRNIIKVKFEIFGNVDNKGIVLPESLLQVNVPMDKNENPRRFSVVSEGKVSGCLDFFRNIFYTVNLTTARVCIYDPITEGRISNVRILDNGKNYLSEPTITFPEPPEGYQIDDGTGNMIDFTRQAEGVAKLDTEGKINRIEMVDPGAGYGWKEGGYPNEKSTAIHPSAYTLLKIKSGAKVAQIIGTNHFVGEKFFSYDYQLANGTKRKVDPVSVTIKANPDDSLSNTISMGVSSEELDAINEQQFGIKEMSVDDVEAKSYLASEMSEKVLICGSSKLGGTSIPQGGHQDDFAISTEDNSQDGALIQGTPDDEGLGGDDRKDNEDEIVGYVVPGTSELDKQETDATSSESFAKALGIVNTTSLADYRTIKRPERNPYPWLSGMSSSTRPDYPMFFGTAPGTEISADAFNNMVDAANSLNKVSIDIPIYVMISKFTKYIYTSVGRAGLSLSFDPEIDYDIDALSVPENEVLCGTDFPDELGLNSVKGISMPFDDPARIGNTLKDRKITTSMKSGKAVATFEYAPETYVKEMRAIIAGDIEAEVVHNLIFGCFAKGYKGYETFIETKQVWTEYEILPFGTYAKAWLGDLMGNLNEDGVSYNGLIDVVGGSCSWGPKGKVQSKGASVKIRGSLWASHYTSDPIGTTIYGPITNDYNWSYPVTVSAKGELKIDPFEEVGGTIYGIYGAASTFDLPEGGGMGTAPVPGNTFCAPSLSKFLTFPRGRSDGLVINLDTTKTNAADCF